MPEGGRLEQGATFINLRDPTPNPKPFKALAGMTAEPRDIYIPKNDTPYVLWNRLIGVSNPERLDEASEQ